MQDYLDLAMLLKAKGNKIYNTKVYGRIERVISKPSTFGSNVEVSGDGEFVAFRLFAVDFEDSAIEGVVGKRENYIYFVNGSIACYLDKDVVERAINLDEAWYRLEGCLQLSTKTNESLVSLFDFTKQGDKFVIQKSKGYDIDFNRIPAGRVRTYLEDSCKHYSFKLPKEVFTFNECVAECGAVLGDFRHSSRELYDRINEIASTAIIPSSEVSTRTLPNRFKMEALSESYPLVRLQCDAVLSNKIKWISKIKEDHPLVSGEDNSAWKVLSRILKCYKGAGSTGALSGSVILTKYLKSIGVLSRGVLSSGDESLILHNLKSVVDSGYYGSVNVVGRDLDEQSLRNSFSNIEVLFAGLLGSMLDLDVSALQKTAMLCYNNEVSFSSVVYTNPYYLAVLAPDLSLNIIERIALALRVTNKRVSKFRSMVYVWRYLKNCSSTCLSCCSLSGSKAIGVTISQEEYEMLENTGSVVTDITRRNICNYLLGTDVEDVNFSYPTDSWFSISKGMFRRPLSRAEISEGLSYGESKGTIVNFKLSNIVWSSDAETLEKELFIYKNMQDRSQEDNLFADVSNEVLEVMISAYEDKVGVSLEPKQREAVYLLRNRAFAVSGVIGSGKTDITKCILQIIRDIAKSKGVYLNIGISSPSLLSCKKLSISLGEPVRTLSSLLNLQADDTFTSGFKAGYGGEVEVSSLDLLIINNMSMVGLDVLYDVLRRCPNTQIMFVGDYRQLTPIGRGTPFKNLLRFIPTVNLPISDKCSGSSSICYNANIITNHSDTSNWKSLVSGDRFKIVPCPDDAIGVVCQVLCEYHSGKCNIAKVVSLFDSLNIDKGAILDVVGVSTDNIQVLSPVSRGDLCWSTSAINTKVRNILNPLRDTSNSFLLKSFMDTKEKLFSVGDRVTHTKNLRNVQWYASVDKDGVCKKTWGNGVINGEIGKISAILRGTDIEVLECEGTKPNDYVVPMDLRDDLSNITNSTVFVAVEYQDTTDVGRHFVLYRGDELEDGIDKLPVFRGRDLELLGLAYCSTVHRMRSSQSEVVLFAMGTSSLGDFISRNMIYSAVTSAKQGIYLIGDVSPNSSSQLSKARRIVDDKKLTTAGKFISA